PRQERPLLHAQESGYKTTQGNQYLVHLSSHDDGAPRRCRQTEPKVVVILSAIADHGVCHGQPGCGSKTPRVVRSPLCHTEIVPTHKSGGQEACRLIRRLGCVLFGEDWIFERRLFQSRDFSSHFLKMRVGSELPDHPAPRKGPAEKKGQKNGAGDEPPHIDSVFMADHQVPDPAVDARLHGDEDDGTVVEYLRTCFLCGGFPPCAPPKTRPVRNLPI